MASHPIPLPSISLCNTVKCVELVGQLIPMPLATIYCLCCLTVSNNHHMTNFRASGRMLSSDVSTWICCVIKSVVGGITCAKVPTKVPSVRVWI